MPWAPGDEIFLGPWKTLRVLKVVALEEGDSPYAGFLMLETAQAA